jgi:hypothetical protein
VWWEIRRLVGLTSHTEIVEKTVDEVNHPLTGIAVRRMPAAPRPYDGGRHRRAMPSSAGRIISPSVAT